MQNRWITGVTLALLVTAPVVIEAQTSTERPGTKTESTTDKVKDTTEKATGATKDSWITSKAKIALFGDERVPGKDVQVETRDGVVTLRGKVSTAEEKRAAEEVVKGIDGVRSVRNNLQVVAASERKAVNAEDKDVKNAVERQIKQDARLKGGHRRPRRQRRRDVDRRREECRGARPRFGGGPLGAGRTVGQERTARKELGHALGRLPPARCSTG
jgi:hyperosmotically inducible periplasmic protein